MALLALPFNSVVAQQVPIKVVKPRSDLPIVDSPSAFWELSHDEVQRLQLIKQGPALLLENPNLDPWTLLGIFARTPEERDRYAEKYSALNSRVTDQLLEFDKAEHLAAKRLQRRSAPVSASSPKHLKLWVSPECPNCRPAVSRAIALAMGGVRVDVYFFSASNPAIQKWASDHQVPRHLVFSQGITLNHDKGALKALGFSGSELPFGIDTATKEPLRFWEARR